MPDRIRDEIHQRSAHEHPVIALVPLAIGSGAPGREIEGPLAFVILGGLFSSTALTLFVLPALAIRFGRFRKREQEGAVH